jgi:hypothetical protein
MVFAGDTGRGHVLWRGDGRGLNSMVLVGEARGNEFGKSSFAFVQLFFCLFENGVGQK